MLYHLLDIFFVIFHTFLLLFNLSGWIWRKTRKINLAILILTGASWSLLGWIVGVPGYCPLTDWHFNILERLGRTNLPSSYVKYLADRITGADFSQGFIDKFTLYSFLAALAISIFLNIKDLTVKIRKKQKENER
ncbi:MAG TPA: DUF2784 domain-containing protein [Bacteroidales bacterium]|jgi:hypothetical protein|nr:DUF2784 family protein [Bacteroidales bacterium]OQB62295.1 MAG: hypothetical protein BWX96_01461 [Bacteroidetes bacterium ADurb.Bin145]NMD01925.1 DUF2784 domain-containing protein [Bacteroidales bacterium]HOU02837.1 DUF2784 domain-containing protein [Bacteroidales bacterium]HQG63018.1 DUF2784 domain-containing protein [Bacteroidales bacterium]